MQVRILERNVFARVKIQGRNQTIACLFQSSHRILGRLSGFGKRRPRIEHAYSGGRAHDSVLHKLIDFDKLVLVAAVEDLTSLATDCGL